MENIWPVVTMAQLIIPGHLLSYTHASQKNQWQGENGFNQPVKMYIIKGFCTDCLRM